MRLETAQVLDLLGLTKETLRHWKKVLAPLSGRDGRSNGYTFDEVVALALIASATTNLQVPISRFSQVAYRLFQDVADHVDDTDTTTVLCITQGDVALYPIDKLPGDACLAFVRLAPTIRRLHQRLTPEPRVDPQLSLDFDGAAAPHAITQPQRKRESDVTSKSASPSPIRESSKKRFQEPSRRRRPTVAKALRTTPS